MRKKYKTEREICYVLGNSSHYMIDFNIGHQHNQCCITPTEISYFFIYFCFYWDNGILLDFFPRLRDTAIKSPILIFTTADKEKYISRDKIFYIFKEKLCIYEVNISECQNHLAFGNIHIWVIFHLLLLMYQWELEPAGEIGQIFTEQSVESVSHIWLFASWM